jgi:TolB protein
MKVLSIQLQFCKLTLIAFFLTAPALQVQSSAAHVEAAPSEPHLRSRLFIYDLHDGSSRLVYSADSIWEAPNWSPDGKCLIANSGGGIYKLVIKQDGMVEPQRLAVPANFSMQ